jgi:uncharacterized membrane protein (DUF485 family)
MNAFAWPVSIAAALTLIGIVALFAFRPAWIRQEAGKYRKSAGKIP